MGRGPTVTGFFLTNETNAVRPAEQAGVAVSGTPPLEAMPAYNGAIVPLPLIGDRAAGAGFVSIQGDRDGIIRAAPLLSSIDGRIVPSLSLEALRVAQGAGAVVVRSSDGSGEMGAGEATSVVAVKTGAWRHRPPTRASCGCTTRPTSLTASFPPGASWRVT